MKWHHKPSSLIIMLLALTACSGGPEKKPLPVSLSSPALLLDQGIIRYDNDNYPGAIHTFKKALAQYRSIDDQAGIAKSCLNITKSLMANNHNEAASQYLIKARSVIEQASLDELDDHLKLVESTLAIKNQLYQQAIQDLENPLASKSIGIRLAALKNRTLIAFSQGKDKQRWLDRYRALQNKNQENTTSHLARILRFEAELDEDNNKKIERLSRSLNISRNLANRTAIAANLTQWADLDYQKKRFEEAGDKLLRALFIRQQLGDIKNSLMILKKLNLVYAATDADKQERAEHWIRELSQDRPIDWEQLFSVFETYPKS
ncbi:MAG TPA: hypothetical protein ENJ87_03675 [Gammaproteobacteria bacterium]|nr:hypothetical protein [Gammaproteobacteria bacterium]